jgi:hypothetical protein
VAEAAVALRALRREAMQKLNYSLRDLYRTLEQTGDNPLRESTRATGRRRSRRLRNA